MGKSATALGREFGRNGREMNELLLRHGYLYGSPGAYGLTEKGQRFGEEQDHHRGTGGYSHYNRYWETRTWSDETAAALKADMEANPGGAHPPGEPVADKDQEASSSELEDYVHYADEDPPISWLGLAGIAGVLVLAPHVKPVWERRIRPAVGKLHDEKVQPRIDRLRHKYRAVQRAGNEVPDGSGPQAD